MGNTVRLRELAVPIPAHAKLLSIDEATLPANYGGSLSATSDAVVIRRRALRSCATRSSRRPARSRSMLVKTAHAEGRGAHAVPFLLGRRTRAIPSIRLGPCVGGGDDLANSRTSSRRSAGSSVSSLCFSCSTKLLMIAASSRSRSRSIRARSRSSGSSQSGVRSHGRRTQSPSLNRPRHRRISEPRVGVAIGDRTFQISGSEPATNISVQSSLEMGLTVDVGADQRRLKIGLGHGCECSVALRCLKTKNEGPPVGDPSCHAFSAGFRRTSFVSSASRPCPSPA
jgi:hypothetical protein